MSKVGYVVNGVCKEELSSSTTISDPLHQGKTTWQKKTTFISTSKLLIRTIEHDIRSINSRWLSTFMSVKGHVSIAFGSTSESFLTKGRFLSSSLGDKTRSIRNGVTPNEWVGQVPNVHILIIFINFAFPPRDRSLHGWERLDSNICLVNGLILLHRKLENIDLQKKDHTPKNQL